CARAVRFASCVDDAHQCAKSETAPTKAVSRHARSSPIIGRHPVASGLCLSMSGLWSNHFCREADDWKADAHGPFAQDIANVNSFNRGSAASDVESYTGRPIWYSTVRDGRHGARAAKPRASKAAGDSTVRHVTLMEDAAIEGPVSCNSP